jgi:hypothetical protein
VEFGKSATYVVANEFAFLQEFPDSACAEERLTVKQLSDEDPLDASPFLYYGENIVGMVEKEHPSVLSADMSMFKYYGNEQRGRKGAHQKGYIPLRELWLEPSLDQAKAPRYMCKSATAVVRLIPTANSREVLQLIQGEVLDAVGLLTYEGQTFIKVLCRSDELLRYGYIAESDVVPLVPGRIDQTTLSTTEIPGSIRKCGKQLSVVARTKLSSQGFFVEPTGAISQIDVDDMSDRYSSTDYGEQYFITSDLFLHATHVVMTRMMQSVEEGRALPLMNSAVQSLASAVRMSIKNDTGLTQEMIEALVYDEYFLSIAASLLDSSFVPPGEIRENVESVVDAIEREKNDLPSIKGVMDLSKEDGSQFRARGHYTTTIGLQRYFHGMMWIGRRGFSLDNDKQLEAFLLFPYLIDKAGCADSLKSLGSALTFLFGKEGELTVEHCRTVAKAVLGFEAPGPGQIDREFRVRVGQIRLEANKLLPLRRIVTEKTGDKSQTDRMAEAACFKLLGQRFSWDAYIFNQLTTPAIYGRNLPSPYDAMDVLGSGAAHDITTELSRSNNWPAYKSKLEILRKDFNGRDDKKSTFYDSWLEVVRTLFAPWKCAQRFCQVPEWGYKCLNTGLATWTELKHVALLYGEQSGAEAGEGGGLEAPPYDPPEPKGYVEPAPELFAALGETLGQLLANCRNNGFVNDEYTEKISTLQTLCTKADAVAEEEVQGAPVSRGDYLWIKSLVYQFGRELLWPRGLYAAESSKIRMALVADVATDYASNSILEVATGAPQRLWVAVKDAFGGTRITVGYVYSWYEFTDSKRWTDEEWQQIIYEKNGFKNIGKEPSWYTKILGPEVR